MAQYCMAGLARCHHEVSMFRLRSIVQTYNTDIETLAGSYLSSPLVIHRTDDRHRHLQLLRPTTKKQSYHPNLRSPLTETHKQHQKHRVPQKKRARPSHTIPHPRSPPAYHARPRPSPFLKEIRTTKTSKHNCRPNVRNSATADSQACWNCAAVRRASSRGKEARLRISALWSLGSESRRRALRSDVHREIWAR
jgi:hypothetical protein